MKKLQQDAIGRVSKNKDAIERKVSHVFFLLLFYQKNGD
jgi:hypothetical protein